MNIPLELGLALAGLVIGSFLNVVIHRVPLKRSLWYPGSSCPQCGTPILWFHNVPLWGYAVQMGRCRSCHRSISFVYPAVEIAAAAILCVFHIQFGFSILFYKASFLALLMLTLAVIDYRYHIIPNRLLFFSLPFGVFFVALEGASALAGGIAGMFLGGAVMAVIAMAGRAIYKKDAMGGGDVKLTALLGLFLGWKLLIVAVVLAFVFLSLAGWIGLALKKIERHTEIPMAPFFGVSIIGSLLFGSDLIRWYLDHFVFR